MMTFIDFLKKYSKVPNQFLEDFFHLFDYRDYESNQKIVDFEKVVNWLDITKHKAKDTLIKSYRKNIDYIIKKVNKPEGKGGQNREIILLTIRSFKKFCQLTKSKHGKLFRLRFII